MSTVTQYQHIVSDGKPRKISYSLNKILDELKQRIAEKYHIIEIMLFGSAARGEDTRDSDIDIFVRLPQVNKTIEEEIFNIAYEIELKYDLLIDIIILDDTLLKKYNEQIPIYQNIIKEGIAF